MSDQISSRRGGESELKQQLAQREAELAILNSVQRGLAARLEVQAIYDLVGDGIRDLFRAQVVMISTYDPATETIEHRYAIERGERVYAPGAHPIRGFRTQIVQTRQPVLVNTDVADEAARLGQPTLPGTITPRSWLGVPMMVGEHVTGILSLQDVEHENAFTEAHVRLLQTVAASMSVALENARLWAKEDLYRKALQREFEIGRDIQTSFLPDSLPQPSGWEIAASLKSAREVAGDFYDSFEMSEGTVALILADVCDKGLGAALFMTLFRSLIRAVASLDSFLNGEMAARIPTAVRLKNAVSVANNYVAAIHGDTGMFATVFLGALDTGTGVLSYINGGQLPPILINKDGVREVLKPTGPAVGVIPQARFAIREVAMERGDTLFAHTDGVTDTINPAGEFFNLSELFPCLMEDRPLSALLEEVQQRLEQYAAGRPQVDDITMLALRYKPK